MNSLRLQSPAKVNFRLDVLRKRADGYHDLRMIMQRIGLYDEIEIRLKAKPGIEISCNRPHIPRDRRNIAWKAADAMLRLSGKSAGVSIHLNKNIPVGAGLGGGSSNAATTLMALNELLIAGLSDAELMSIGVELGADVPFFIFKRPALAEGIGELLTPLTSIPKLWLLLVNPGVHVATSWAYKNLSLTRENVAAKLPFHFNSASDLCQILANDLEPVTVGRFPVIAEIKQLLLSAGAEGVLMSGSGSTVFAVYPEEASALQALVDLPKRDNWFTTVVPTI